MTNRGYFIALAIFIAFVFVRCSSPPDATIAPQVVYVTATPQIVEITATSNPTITATVPAPETPRSAVTFVDSGQRLGLGRSWDVALGDLDSDGDLDAFVTNGSQGDRRNAIWLNDGEGKFAISEQELGFGMGVVLGDFDADADLDALVTDWYAPAVIWLNDGNGVFTDSGRVLIDGDGMGAALGDLDGDGDLDFFLARDGGNTAWINDGAGNFTDTAQHLGEEITDDVALGDLDNDGDLDILAGGWDEHARVWLNDGSGTFTDSGKKLTSKYLHIHGLELGDLDSDADLDVFMAIAGDINQVWFNDGAGNFSLKEQEMPFSSDNEIALGDLDSDGDLDAFIAIALSGDQIWLNDGFGNYVSSGLRLGDQYSAQVQLGDLDSDGDLDAFIAHGNLSLHSGGGLPNTVWLNETSVLNTLQLPKVAIFGNHWTRPSDNLAMIFVPSGTFPMGSTLEEIDAAIALCREHYSICNRWYYMREDPQHLVIMDGFWIDQTEVTNAQYHLCVEAGVCSPPLECKRGESTYYDQDKADHPVVCVDWFDAQTYCDWAGARLPTEAEWEYAFRGEAGVIYPWGDQFDGSRLNYCDANCRETHADDRYDDGYEKTSPVMSYPQGASWVNAWAMSGNVSEWVADWLSDFTPEEQTNPIGPETGSEKILKGCSWTFHPTYCRGALRASIPPSTRYDFVGFRCAATQED